MNRTISEMLQYRRRNGYKTGGPVPFGFDADSTGKLTENPDEQQNIDLMHEWQRRGYTLRAIAAELEKRGIITRTGKSKWQISVISDILKRGIDKSQKSPRVNRKKLQTLALLGNKCYICDYQDETGISLDFHHLDESTKTNRHGGLMGTTGIQFEKELQGCIILCANCHRKLHAGIIEIKNKEKSNENIHTHYNYPNQSHIPFVMRK